MFCQTLQAYEKPRSSFTTVACVYCICLTKKFRSFLNNWADKHNSNCMCVCVSKNQPCIFCVNRVECETLLLESSVFFFSFFIFRFSNYYLFMILSSRKLNALLFVNKKLPTAPRYWIATQYWYGHLTVHIGDIAIEIYYLYIIKKGDFVRANLVYSFDLATKCLNHLNRLANDLILPVFPIQLLCQWVWVCSIRSHIHNVHGKLRSNELIKCIWIEWFTQLQKK